MFHTRQNFANLISKGRGEEVKSYIIKQRRPSYQETYQELSKISRFSVLDNAAEYSGYSIYLLISQDL